MKTHACQQHLLTNDPIYENIHVYIQCNAPINVNPEGGGRSWSGNLTSCAFPWGKVLKFLNCPVVWVFEIQKLSQSWQGKLTTFCIGNNACSHVDVQAQAVM